MHIDEEKLNKILHAIANIGFVKALELLRNGKALTFTEMNITYKKTVGVRTNVISHYLKLALDSNLVRRENGYYYLTRYGVQVLNLVAEFKSICIKYDMNDVGADGKVLVKVIGRKL